MDYLDLLFGVHLKNSRGLFPEDVLLHLAGDGHGELVPRTEKMDVPGDLEVRDLAVAVLADLLCIDHCAGPRFDPGHDFLAVQGVRHPDDLNRLDLGVEFDDVFDLLGGDVLTTADDHVLDPADDRDVAVTIHPGHVAGVHPAGMIDDLGGGLRVVPVAAHHRVAAHPELAVGFTRDRQAGITCDDGNLDVRMDSSDCRGPAVDRVLDEGLG